jgi:tRNA modification GTPase
MVLDDTIVALSSPAGAGERAVVRLSGPDAARIGDRLFAADDGTPIADWPTYSARPGRLCLDRGPQAGRRNGVPATAYLMRAPRSYTRQDVLEFHVGAWPALEAEYVEGVLAAGARAAEPGEFTLRAFAAGRIDLAQAEAVMAVVAASSESALRAAGDLLRGHLSRDVSALADRLRDLLALVEVDLDFSDQEAGVAPAGEVAARIADLRNALASLGRRSRSLETSGGEVRLVIAGRPNAGKSSLFNRLLRRDRAIVTPEAGTTRDELRATLHLGEFSLVLSDTAGLDMAGGELAEKARAKTLEALARADLVLLVVDATATSYEPMEDVLGLLAAPLVVAATKCDLDPGDRALAWLGGRGLQSEVVRTSALKGEGIEALARALQRAVEGGAVDREAAGPVVTARGRAALEQAAGALDRAGRLARRGGGGELVALELREALDAVGSIVGRRTPEDVLGAIFAHFCIGK